MAQYYDPCKGCGLLNLSCEIKGSNHESGVNNDIRKVIIKIIGIVTAVSC